MFVKHDESMIALKLDLYTLISASEQPPTDPATGKAQLIVDDARWTPDCQFVLILLRGAQDQQNASNNKKGSLVSTPGTLCILPRLGVSFIRVFNPTRFNISKYINGSQPGVHGGHKASSIAIGSSIAAKEDIMIRPQKFMQLIMSDTVENNLKNIQNYLNYNKKWKI